MSQQQSIKSATVTKEALTFPVDYNDPTATLIPSKAIFCAQAAITQFLAAKGTSNFKYLVECWDALPNTIAHDITFNVASGVQRPRNPESYTAAFNIGNRIFLGARRVYIIGAAPSNYTQLVASQSITGLSSDPYDPWMDFAGTPFAGMNLRGYYVVFNTGQVSVIHKHTSSRLYVIDVPSPTPTSCFVGKPSTVLRNSYNDIVAAKSSSCVSIGYDHGQNIYPRIIFQDILVECFGAGWGFIVSPNAGPNPIRVLIDLANEADTFSVPITGTRAIQIGAISGGSYTICTGFSIRGPAFASPSQAINPNYYSIYVGDGGAFSLNTSYVGGAAPVYIAGPTAYFYGHGAVFDQIPYGAVRALNGARVTNQDEFYTGQQTIFRNCSGGGLWYDGGAFFTFDTQGGQFLFEGCAGPCVKLGSYVQLNSLYWGSVRLKNGPAGGNTDVGIQVDGPHVNLEIDPTTNVTGTLGDVRMSGGDIHSYADIVTNGPYTDLGLNVIKKVS
jgi:hypothetical protein